MGYGSQPMIRKLTNKAIVKKPKTLTENQMNKLKKHSKMHGGMNSKHMKNMKAAMLKGMSFNKAHLEAVKLDKTK